MWNKSALKKTLILRLEVVRTEGHMKMPAIHKSQYRRFVTLVILSLLFTPIAVFTGGTNGTPNTKVANIGTHLADALTTMDTDQQISVIVEFPDGTSADEMVEEIKLAGIDSVEIRYAFQLIPMISLSIRSDHIQDLAQVTRIEGITLNQQKQYLTDLLPQDNYVLADNGDGYVHFDTILGADLLWAEGFNGTGTTVAILDSGAYGEHPDIQDRLIGFKDLINGFDDMNPAGGIQAYDDNGHGTACAWNVAGDGTESSGTLKGVAPGADLLIIKVLDATGSGDDDVIAQGIEAVGHVRGKIGLLRLLDQVLKSGYCCSIWTGKICKDK